MSSIDPFLRDLTNVHEWSQNAYQPIRAKNKTNWVIRKLIIIHFKYLGLNTDKRAINLCIEDLNKSYIEKNLT